MIMNNKNMMIHGPGTMMLLTMENMRKEEVTTITIVGINNIKVEGIEINIIGSIHLR